MEKSGIQTVELFCGTKSFSKVAQQHNLKTLTIDNDKQHNPDILTDILNLDLSLLPKNIDILWASPPCTTFSIAARNVHWGRDEDLHFFPKTENAKIGAALILQTKEIIKQLNPTFWFIENPMSRLRKMDLLSNIKIKHLLTYCQYGDTRMKPTDFWTNCEQWIPKPACKNGMPCHERAPRGSKTGTQGLKGAVERGAIPPALIEEIIKTCLENL